MVVIQNADGRLEVFALAEGRSLWHIWQTAPNGTWSPWTSFGNGGPPGLSHIGAPHAAKNADGRLEVFLTTPTLGIPDIVLFHISQVTSGVGWGDWTSFDAPTNLSINSDVSAAENADGRLEVFLTNSDQTLWHAGQMIPGPGAVKDRLTAQGLGAGVDVLLPRLVLSPDFRRRGASFHTWLPR